VPSEIIRLGNFPPKGQDGGSGSKIKPNHSSG
jgi:hypothetical protein